MERAVTLDQGRRSVMQDKLLVADNFFAQGNLLGIVCDGHSDEGEAVAQTIVREIPKVLGLKLGQKIEIKRALIETFAQVSGIINYENSGATVLAFLCDGLKVYFANAGDCRLIVIGNNYVQQLTNDHRLECGAEKQRVLALGAHLSGSYVCLGDGSYGLMPTRTFGDRRLNSVGIISEPEVGCYELLDTDEYLIAATDGLYDELSNN